MSVLSERGVVTKADSLSVRYTSYVAGMDKLGRITERRRKELEGALELGKQVRGDSLAVAAGTLRLLG